MPAHRPNAILEVHVILAQGSSIFLLQRRNTGYEDGKFSLPAGHVEQNESIDVAGCREAQEETSVIIRPEELELAHTMHRHAPESRVGFFFRALQWTGIPKNNEQSKCDKAGWFSLSQLPPNTSDYIQSALEKSRLGLLYSSWGW